jgi:hypothetical protein
MVPAEMIARADAVVAASGRAFAGPTGRRVYPLRDDADALVLWFPTRVDLHLAAAVFRAGRTDTGLVPIAIGSPSDDLRATDEVDDRYWGVEGIDLILDDARLLLFDGPEGHPRSARYPWLPEWSTGEPAYDPSDDRFWVDVEPEHTSGIPYDRDSFCLALVDVPSSADAILAMNWSDPSRWPAHVHASVARHWHERHGAEVTGLDDAYVEMVVPEPIPDRDTAFALAVEQWGYAESIGHADCTRINQVASGLLVSTMWTFWWD